MRKNSLITIIILIILVPVAVRIFWVLPIAAIILFVSVFRFVRNILNQDRKEDSGQKVDTEPKKSYYREKANTIITCDYCGSKVDTSKHAVCDHCGGPYWDNEEWKSLHNGKDIG